MSDIEVPEAVPVPAPEPVDSITKPTKVKKERSPAQKAAFAKAQAKRVERMQAKKVEAAKMVVALSEPVVEPVEPEPEPDPVPEPPVPTPVKKKRAPRKKKEPEPEPLPPPAVDKVAPVPEATDIPPIAADAPAGVPTPQPKPAKKMPAPKKQATLVSVKKRAKTPPKEIVFEDSDSESDDEELLAEVYQSYKTKLKQKKAARDKPSAPVMHQLKFV
jgi:hypothetical protein